ncbi:methyltransferase [Raphidocelis subcapitata]|uniref:Methyltransferase n=1 Tax=Raphidocelis subcapitata TaxID=307507 RepID=A0A2V0NT80_9CHLO|nr:methyltransferase [Raphidocelis subcapitata]|eukprot:GBF90888.1 methyltransferase [Raphidocelis subcapitata]
MHAQMGVYETAIAPTKSRVFDALLGPGGGGGGDSQARPPLRLLEPFCREAAAAAGLGEGQLTLVQGSAEAMPFGDGAFDAAVITLVLCSVPDPAAALSEVRRVVAPGGRLALIEHVAAAPAARPLVALGQRLLDPLQGLVADGCHLTRDTGRLLEVQGYDTAGVESFDVDGLGILAPHIAGVIQL